MVRGAGLAAVSLGASRRKLLVERPRAIRRDFRRRIYWTMVWIVRRGEIAAPAVAHNWLEVEGGAINDLAVDEVEDVRDHHELPLHISGRHFRDDRLLLDENARQIFSMIDDVAERVRIGNSVALDRRDRTKPAIEGRRERAVVGH